MNYPENLKKGDTIGICAPSGGITKENVTELAGTGICGIAVISAIFAQGDIESTARELKARTEEIL